MSTPIVMRTKDQQSPFSATAGYQKPVVGQFTRPYQPVAAASTNQAQVMAAQQQQQIQQQQQQQQLQKSECEIYFSGKHDALYIYLSRLMAPIWDLKILNDLQSKSGGSDSGNGDSLLFVTFADINLQWYLNKLNELRRFIDVNFPHLKTLHHSYLTSSLFQPASSVNNPAQTGQGSSAVVTANVPCSRFATQFGNMALNMPALIGLTGTSAG